MCVTLLQAFGNGFQDIKSKQKEHNIFVMPFTVEPDDVPDNPQHRLIQLQMYQQFLFKPKPVKTWCGLILYTAPPNIFGGKQTNNSIICLFKKQKQHNAFLTKFTSWHRDHGEPLRA